MVLQDFGKQFLELFVTTWWIFETLNTPTSPTLYLSLVSLRSRSRRSSRRHYTRSRSRSRSHRRSRSRSYSRDYRRRHSHSHSPMSTRRRHIGNRVRVWAMSHSPGCILASVSVPRETQRGFVKGLLCSWRFHLLLLAGDPNLTFVVHPEALTFTLRNALHCK